MTTRQDARARWQRIANGGFDESGDRKWLESVAAKIAEADRLTGIERERALLLAIGLRGRADEPGRVGWALFLYEDELQRCQAEGREPPDLYEFVALNLKTSAPAKRTAKNSAKPVPFDKIAKPLTTVLETHGVDAVRKRIDRYIASVDSPSRREELEALRRAGANRREEREAKKRASAQRRRSTDSRTL